MSILWLQRKMQIARSNEGNSFCLTNCTQAKIIQTCANQPLPIVQEQSVLASSAQTD